MFDVTLTFDNGPTPGVTEPVLNVLARYDVPATFFVVGQKLQTPEGKHAVARAHVQGHWIGNHTWTHPEPFGEWPGDRDPAPEILSTQRALGRFAHADKFIRPAAGGGFLDRRLLSPAALETIKAQKMTLVLWNSIPRDWENIDDWVSVAMEQFRQNPWSLTVLHDTDTGAMRQLPRFIQSVLDAGGRFRQEFPRECVPIVRGTVIAPIDQYVMVQTRREEAL
jgi:peptidoglycan-N-acetylglucosamine deacetylase